MYQEQVQQRSSQYGRTFPITFTDNEPSRMDPLLLWLKLILRVYPIKNVASTTQNTYFLDQVFP